MMKADVRHSRQPIKVAILTRICIVAWLAMFVLVACESKSAPVNTPAVAATQVKEATSPAPVNPPVVAATSPAPVNTPAVAATQVKPPEGPARNVIVYASDLSQSALYEFDFWNDSASPGGKMIGTPNTGDQLDPPPENDPHVTFKVQVQRDVPYRCWIHMKVGAPKGKSQANMFWVQFSDAIDKVNKQIYKIGTSSYLTAQGPTREGWGWVGCDAPKSSDSLIQFRADQVAVQLQAGMEGVGFDQFLLSPSEFLDKPPAEAILKK